MPLTALSTSSQLRDIFDTTFSRDNSFCRFNHHNFELQIRSIDMYSQPNDRDYGEYPFIIQQGVRYKLDFNQDIGRYRLIYAKEKECTKSLALPLNKEEITLFFAQDNRPFPDLLVLMNYNPQTLKSRITYTQEPIGKYYRLKDKLLFSSYFPRTTMSSIEFNGAHYTLLTSALPLWKSYSQERITIDAQTTFSQFEWKDFFKDLQEFKSSFAWNEVNQAFMKESFELIFNYQLKKRCLRVLHEWRCKAI